MTSQRGQIIRIDRGKYAVRWRDGVSRRQRTGFASRGEARNWIDLELQRIRSGTATRPHATFQELRTVFMASYSAAPSTTTWMLFHLEKIEKQYKRHEISRLDASEIAVWRQSLPPGSAHQTIRVFRQVMAQAVAWGWIDRNVLAAVKNPQPPRTEFSTFAGWSDVERIAVELGDHYRAVIITGVGTGLRVEEIFGLEWSDVDLDARSVMVRRAYAKGRLKRYTKTSGSTRRVPLRRIVADELARHSTSTGRTRGVVFTNEHTGQRINLASWRQREWAPAFEAAGADRLRPYDMRHTYASWSLAAGVPLFSVARRMGTSAQQIQLTYGHLVDGADDAERDLLDAWDSSVSLQVGRAGDASPNEEGTSDE